MKLHSNKCPSCNAPLKEDAKQCDFCGMIILKSKDGKIIYETKDFGIKGNVFFVFIIIGIIIIDILGWKYGYDDYFISWFTDAAFLIWTGVLPIWVLSTTIIWANKWGAVLYGIIIAIILFILHLLIVVANKNWNFNDDYFGLAGIVAGVFLASWLLGRLFHKLIRKSRNKKN